MTCTITRSAIEPARTGMNEAIRTGSDVVVSGGEPLELVFETAARIYTQAAFVYRTRKWR